jgi:hypothetical protein
MKGPAEFFVRIQHGSLMVNRRLRARRRDDDSTMASDQNLTPGPRLAGRPRVERGHRLAGAD